MSKLRNGFASMADANLETKSQAIIAAMTGNVNYPTPTPALTVVEDAIETYSNLLVEAQTRDKTKVAMKRTAKTLLVDQLKILSNYVTLTANGDEAKLVSSGFELARPGLPRPPITAPQNLRVENGLNSGEIICRIDRVQGAQSYLFEYTEEPITAGSVWISIGATSRTHTFTGLTPGKKYWFRVGAIGPRGQLVYSIYVDRIVV